MRAAVSPRTIPFFCPGSRGEPDTSVPNVKRSVGSVPCPPAGEKNMRRGGYPFTSRVTDLSPFPAMAVNPVDGNAAVTPFSRLREATSVSPPAPM